jgi:phage terminase small subunit
MNDTQQPQKRGPGRPRKPVETIDVAATENALEFLRAVMNDAGADVRVRVDAAKALASYTIERPGAAGKKAARLEAAHKVAAKFGSLDAPVKLKAV